MRRHFVHDCPPSSLRHFRIVRGEISASDIEIQRRDAMRFIHRVKQALGIMPIARFKAALFSRMVFLPIENAATPAVE